ncbi:MAG: hypothetical protein HQ566_05885 [Candidatus Omnitrophica bacterium]|nr:hypothetical protein [Candidatus Omnitrophota bacterium]
MIVNFSLGFTDIDKHELEHVYIYLSLEKLKKEGQLSLSIAEADNLLGWDDGLPMLSAFTLKIDNKEIEMLEDIIIQALLKDNLIDTKTILKTHVTGDTKDDNIKLLPHEVYIHKSTRTSQ